MSKFKVGSMFAGMGGICLGFKQARFDIVWANEKDKAACKTYRYNFGNTYLQECDITKVDASTIPNFDVLVAGFPCQPFSIAGKQRGFKDPRGNMFFEIARIIDVKKPKIVFLENVANLREHDNGNTFLVIYNTLATLGYSVRYHTMSGNEHGNLPQTRNRIFIVAFLDDVMCDHFKFPDEVPLTTHINDIIHRSQRQHDIYYLDAERQERLKKYVQDRTSIYRFTDRGIHKVKNNMCPTLTASMGYRVERVPMVCDDFGIRHLTLRECLGFQGFPDEFWFPNTVTINDAYKQIGNGVCVPVINKIAEKIQTILIRQNTDSP